MLQRVIPVSTNGPSAQRLHSSGGATPAERSGRSAGLNWNSLGVVGRVSVEEEEEEEEEEEGEGDGGGVWSDSV